MTTSELDRLKAAAAAVAAALVEDGMIVGLGSGSTASLAVSILGRRVSDGLRIIGIPTSEQTDREARRLGIPLSTLAEHDHIDVTIDGADQVAPDGWLVKGGGGAHVREKIVAAAAERFVVMVDSGKPVEALTPPVPLELSGFGLRATLRALNNAELRDAPPSPDGGVLADYAAPFADPGELAAWLAAMPGVVDHGLFPPEMVSDVLVGRGTEVQALELTA